MTTARRSDARSTFIPAPAGLHQAVCVDIVDLGVVASKFGDKHKVRLVWQVAAVHPDTGRRHELKKLYTLSLHDRASLRKDLESWRGVKFQEHELRVGFVLEKCLGVNCMLQVVHDVSDDGATWANVSVVLPVAKGVVKLAPVGYTRVQDRDRRSA